MKFFSKERIIIFLKLLVAGIVGWSVWEFLHDDPFDWLSVLFMSFFFSLFMTLTYEGWAWGAKKKRIFDKSERH